MNGINRSAAVPTVLTVASTILRFSIMIIRKLSEICLAALFTWGSDRQVSLYEQQ